MKLSIALLAAVLPFLVDASPLGERHKDSSSYKSWGPSSKNGSRHADKKYDNDWKGSSHQSGSKGSPRGNSPFYFTSTIETWASPDTIVNANNTPVAGLEGASAHYRFGINSIDEVICYNITFYGFPDAQSLNYSSPAATATHIHQAAPGRAGPPRIAFPNPRYSNETEGLLQSLGCLTGPFVTGLAPNGTDTGSASGFKLANLEADPYAFFADVHLGGRFIAGAVRGQLYSA